METALQIIFVLAILILLMMFVLRPNQKKESIPLPEPYQLLLNEHVAFYQKLDEEGKKKFEERVQNFLTTIKITGVRTEVEDLDRVLIGASAIIPIFAFPDWEYVNIHEVLLYPGTFNEEYELEGDRRFLTGMVGSGALQHVMILSQQGLREGFHDRMGSSNPGIHEFVHLIDKTDGSVDGLPEVLLQHKYVLPWLEMVRIYMNKMIEESHDINPYGATNQAEFFAVVSEYFFKRPDQLQQNHPELYGMLQRIFGHSV